MTNPVAGQEPGEAEIEAAGNAFWKELGSRSVYDFSGDGMRAALRAVYALRLVSGPDRAALVEAQHLIKLMDEMAHAVDLEAEDIGTGPRGSLTVLQEIGPLIAPTLVSIDRALSSAATGART